MRSAHNISDVQGAKYLGYTQKKKNKRWKKPKLMENGKAFHVSFQIDGLDKEKPGQIR